jgi:hypothetical protein
LTSTMVSGGSTRTNGEPAYASARHPVNDAVVTPRASGAYAVVTTPRTVGTRCGTNVTAAGVPVASSSPRSISGVCWWRGARYGRIESSVTACDVRSDAERPAPDTPVLPSTWIGPGPRSPAAIGGAHTRSAAVAKQPGFATSRAPGSRSEKSSGRP